MMKPIRYALSTAIALIALATSPGAQADCIDPARAEGVMVYNSDHNTMQFCNGTNWINMGAPPVSTVWQDGGSGKLYYNGGNVGIGAKSPGAKLHVLGEIESRVDGDVNIGGALALTNSAKSTGTSQRWRLLNMGGTYGNSLQFWAYDDVSGSGCSGGVCSSKVTFLDNGNVGIGASTPVGKLEVEVATNESVVVSDITNLVNVSDFSSGQAYLGFTRSTDGIQVAGLGMYNNTNLFLASYGDLVFGSGINSYQYLSEKMRLTSAGNLSIVGTASKPGGGSWTASSDARLKKIDGTYETGLDALAVLQPVRFRYKDGNPRDEPIDKQFIGLVAQDAQNVMPELVSEDDDGYLNLDPSALTYALINAVKELKAENDKLRTDFEAYKAAQP